MLTRNRRHLAPVALNCFKRQDWRERELLVVDDGEDAIEDLCRDVPNCRYFWTPRFRTVGDKLNWALEKALGEVIVTFDDDDWYADGRITDQVNRLVKTGMAMTGYHTILFWDGARASRYSNPPVYPTGTSQVYWKSFWKQNKFPAENVGYDNALFAAAKDKVASVNGGQMVVARLHGANVGGARAGSIGIEMWPWVEASEIPAEFFEAIR